MVYFQDDSALRKYCSESIYRNNPFFILGLPTNASPRQIRRRREDFEVAFANGTDNDEFSRLPRCEPPLSQDRIHQLFDELNDPQYRLISEFFWFWPMTTGGHVSFRIPTFDREFADEIHDVALTSDSSEERITAKHNLAVLRHYSAIECDMAVLASSGICTSSASETANDAWEKAIDLWASILWNEELWNLFRKRIAEFGDPRLSPVFLTQLKKAAPFILANANANLLFKYAENHDADSVQRHLKYMRWLVDDNDDAESILTHLFRPKEREIALLIKRYDLETQSSPENAIVAAKGLLDEGENAIRLAELVFYAGHPMRQDIVKDVAVACNRYQVAYANKTGDWKKSLQILIRLQSIGLPEDVKKLIDGNLKLAEKNYEVTKLTRYCWFCQENLADDESAIEVHLYGDLKCEIEDSDSRKYRVTWSKRAIKVPRCRYCASLCKQREHDEKMGQDMLDKAINARSFWRRLFSIKTLEMRNEERKLRKIRDLNFMKERQELAHTREYPPLHEALCNGYKVGTEPSQRECENIYKTERELMERGGYALRGKGFVMTYHSPHGKMQV